MTNKPIRATNHCRHYSYTNWPRCAVNGVQRNGVNHCLPEPGLHDRCTLREDYTEKERLEWEQYLGESFARIRIAIEALPKPIALNTSGRVECPNCKGNLFYSRWERGAAIHCETESCVGPTRFNIKRGADWPV